MSMLLYRGMRVEVVIKGREFRHGKRPRTTITVLGLPATRQCDTSEHTQLSLLSLEKRNEMCVMFS